MSKIPVFLRAAFNYDTDAVSAETAHDCNFDPDTGEELPSMTQQQFKEECDINEIVRRFGLTGQMPDDVRIPVSGDFTGISDFKQAMDAVVSAQEEFMRLPAELRERFRNDPQELIAFVSDEGNRDEAVKLGLVPKPAEKTRDVVQAVDELSAKIVSVAKS